MNKISETLDEILSEYSSQENLIQEKLLILRKKRLEFLKNQTAFVQLQFETPEDAFRTKENALRRNKALRRDLNISISKLRSKQCYNPAEDNLNRMIDKYSEILSRGITYMSDIRDTRPRNGLKPYKRSSAGRFWCSSFRLNNNNIVSIQGIGDMVQQVNYRFRCEIFEIPENLTWLDLSFNKLTYLHSEISELKNLKILYLHGNLFSQFTPVLYHLQALNKLYSLTLHGNPIEEVRGYRQRVLSVLPNLKNLDFTNVTNSDFENCDFVQKSNNSR